MTKQTDQQLKNQQITVCAFIHHNGKLLIAKRADTKPFLPGKYELIGGHIEVGETPEQALKREIQEEIHVEIKVENSFYSFTYLRDKDQAFSIEVDYFATLVSPIDQIKLNPEDHSEYRWITEEEIEKYLPKGDEEIMAVKKGFSLLKKQKIEQQDITSLQEQLNEAEIKYKRALADYQNLEKRASQQREDWIKLSSKEILLRLLPILDALILASKHLDDKGLKVSINMFLDTLKAEGVTKIKTTAEKFNPETMECIQTEKGEEGKVLEELRTGYMIHDKLLRPAQVKVGQ